MYNKLVNKEAKLALVGLGYVGLPIALEFAKKISVIGFDINEERLAKMRQGIDPCKELDHAAFEEADIKFTSSIDELREASFFIVAVPTPIDRHNQPDLTPLLSATRSVAHALKRGNYVVYESTVYPGCTEEDCLPILEEISGLKAGVDFKIGYSPERINPGEKVHTLPNTIKIVSGCDGEALDVIAKVYELVVKPGVHRAPNIKVAEAAKIIENTQRDVNIALMNELSIIFSRIGINTYDVLEAAGTKWNFLKFYPGLVGGHCIGVDPYYLVYKASELKYHTQIISMTFKENVADIRNSKVVDIINELKDFGVDVDVVDAYADSEEVKQMYGFGLIEKPRNNYDAVIVAVSHDAYKDLDEKYFKSLAYDNAVLVDVKGMYRGKIQELKYWSL